MTVSAKSLGIEALPVADRLALVDEIWEGICADSSAFPWTAEQRAELARREADDEIRPDDVVAAEEVFLGVRERLAKRK